MVAALSLVAATSWSAAESTPDALQAWRDALACATSDAGRVAARSALADTYRHLGRDRLALLELDAAAELAADDDERLALMARRGGTLLALGDTVAALPLLHAAFERHEQLEPERRLTLYNDLANALAITGSPGEAIALFDRAHQTARAAGRADAAARAAVNALRAQIDDKNLAGLEERLTTARADILALHNPATRARLQVSLADLFRRAVDELGAPEQRLVQARAMLESAALLAGTPPSGQDAASAVALPGVLGYAYGFLGALDERAGDLAPALANTRRALDYAGSAAQVDQVYRWEWQAGRILERQGDRAAALAAYERAVQLLEAIRSTGTLPQFSRVAPIYTQYADALLRQVGGLPQADAGGQAGLLRVRGLLESLKRAEVEDYFATSCVTRSSEENLARELTGGTAVLYPVLLESRLELLLESPGSLQRFSAPVGRAQITDVVRRFRLALERPASGDTYLAGARQLHTWLIEPLLPSLRRDGVHTLVIVPDGALRTVPLAALHDGERFLVEQFAVATTPIFGLTAPPTAAQGQVLVGGISESVQGFPALPKVAEEIQQIAGNTRSRTLQDEAFTLQAVAAGLTRPDLRVAHFATHGEFKSDYRQSFLLTYDDRLTLERMQSLLRARGGEPLDLLVLSACRTAAGDDRAALGLAGVAVQSGARSALASLWYVSDAATAELVARFYEALDREGRSKAESLRQAQLELLGTERFRHPSFWAPYLLIGSWS